jgi:hypothetical protein
VRHNMYLLIKLLFLTDYQVIVTLVCRQIISR